MMGCRNPQGCLDMQRCMDQVFKMSGGEWDGASHMERDPGQARGTFRWHADDEQQSPTMGRKGVADAGRFRTCFICETLYL